MHNMSRYSLVQIFLVLWLILGVTYFLFVPVRAWTADDLHYLGVAWNMFRTHTWLLTYGMADTHQVDLEKTPLLYWIILSVWHLVGVSTYSVKIIIFSIGSACLWLTYQLAGEIFPENKKIAELSLVILLLNLLWDQHFGANIRFDGLVMFFGLLYILCLLKFLRNQHRAWLLTAAFALGGCIFTKGSVAFIYYLPLAVLAPYLVQQKTNLAWCIKIVLTCVIALIVPTLYLIYIYFVLSPEQLNYLLFKQISNRLGLCFHLNVISGVLLSFLPVLLIIRYKKIKIDPRIIALSIQFIFTASFFIFFVIFHTKRYLIPVFPFLALILSFFVYQNYISDRRVILTMTTLSLLIMITNIGSYFSRNEEKVKNLTFLAADIKSLQLQGQEVAQFTGKIPNLHLDFLGRLPKSLPIITNAEEQKQWLKNHPNSYIVINCADHYGTCFQIKTGNKIIALWDEKKTWF